ncbi:MAG TPA: acriflavin resistance protein [Microscillaceae bacterium]|nr:acriflavin resistance protein [Microscillaceae bacterium]
MASLSNVSISRPVLAIVMSIVIIVFGLIGFIYLGVREFPSVDPPIVNVSTGYTGANADIIETQITEPLEEAISGIAGIKTITSVSRDGRSNITIEFNLEISIEEAANDVRDKVSRALRNLPPDVDPPVVSKADANSDPILAINIQSDTRNKLEVSEIANNTFKEQFQTINGVSEVIIWGEQKYAMRLWIDPDKLAAYKITPLDVLQTLSRENVELPSGFIEGNNTELTIRTVGKLNSPADFNNLIIKEDGDKIVRFSDIGRATLDAENLRSILKRDGEPMIAVAIVTQAGSNQVAIAKEVYKRLDKIKKELPADLTVVVGFDNTRYVLASIQEVEETIITAFLLVVMIIFVFLRDWRTTLIPVVTIPISLVGTFFIMYLLNFSINVLTLLGIVLAIGLVVDDAIVVLENIYAKVEKGMNPLEAALKGSKEIYFAVLSTTIALASVFLPVIFLQGLTGRLFREFGLVVAGSVLISAFVSLTLTPMMSSRMLKTRTRQPWLYRVTEPFFEKLNDIYAWLLGWFMRFRWLAFVVMGLSAYAVYQIGQGLPSELAPLEDRNGFRMLVRGPEGVTFEYMEKAMDELTKLVLDDVKEREGIISFTSPGFGAINTGFVRGILLKANERKRSQQKIVESVTAKANIVPGIRAVVTQEPTIGDKRGGLPVQFVIQATSIDKLKAVLPKILAKAGENPKFTYVDVDLKFNKPEIKIDIDREKARNLGVSVADISQTLQLGLSGQRFGYFNKNGKQYQIIGQLDRQNRNDVLDLKSLYVRNKKGEQIQLDNLVKLTEQSTPPQLFRFNRYVSATISANPAPGISLGEGIAEMRKLAKGILDDTYTTSLSGPSRDLEESSSSLLFAFGLALLLIYLVLAAQFESFIDPLIIMLTVPLALAGAILSLWFWNQTLNVFSQIGVIMLIGLVTKNAILIVEFANQRKQEGASVRDAVFEAATSRFRPILMTSLSTILGIAPIALALGAGSESRVSMGIAIIGGLVFATILTLFVIPALYTFFTERKKEILTAERLKELETA